jgi:hypothetical protein
VAANSQMDLSRPQPIRYSTIEKDTRFETLRQFIRKSECKRRDTMRRAAAVGGFQTFLIISGSDAASEVVQGTTVLPVKGIHALMGVVRAAIMSPA